MSNEPIVRKYRESDLAACRSLHAENTQRHRDLYDDQGMGGDQPGLEFDEHLACVGSDNIWLACENERVLAMAGLIPGEKPELEPVVVTESARGRGVGRTLVAAVLAEAFDRGLPQVTVRPVARNAEALAFFRELGFATLGQVDLIARPGGKPRWSRPGARIAGVDLEV